MKIKIVSNFHVFVPNGERDKKVAFVAGAVMDAGDVPEGQSARTWVDRGLAEEVASVGVFDATTEG